MPEFRNNYDLYLFLAALDPKDRQPEYSRLAPTMSFKVKSFGFLMRKGAEVEAAQKKGEKNA